MSIPFPPWNWWSALLNIASHEKPVHVVDFGDVQNMGKGQLSVPLDPALRQFIEREAERQDRTVAGQVRHLIAEAARQSVAHDEERAA